MSVFEQCLPYRDLGFDKGRQSDLIAAADHNHLNINTLQT